MIDAGISSAAFACFLSHRLKGNESERMKEAWQITRQIEAGYSPVDTVLADDLGICPACLEGGWLVGRGAFVKCLSCGESWLVFDNNGVRMY